MLLQVFFFKNKAQFQEICFYKDSFKSSTLVLKLKIIQELFLIFFFESLMRFIQVHVHEYFPSFSETPLEILLEVLF